MINIQWDRKFELGNERIDAEHRIFLDLIKGLSTLAPPHDDPERVARLLRELQRYAEFHFVSEENLMLDVGYPDYEMHRNEHTMLLSTLGTEIRKWSQTPALLDHLVRFLFEWFALHTTQVDKKLARYIDAQHEGAGTAS